MNQSNEGLMAGRTVVVMGVANDRSLGWGIARSLHKEGAQLVFTYRQERSRAKLERLVEDAGIVPRLCVHCDATDDDSIEAAFRQIGRTVGTIHGLVHSLAYAGKEQLNGEFIGASREGFLQAIDVSAYSLVAAAKACRELMSEGGSIVTQSYLGAERAVPNYNTMGVAKAALEACVRYLAADLGPSDIRVNAVSAGPVRTLSARGVGSFSEFYGGFAEKAPLHRHIDADEVGDATLFLLSRLSRGITGEVMHVDAGYHILG